MSPVEPIKTEIIQDDSRMLLHLLRITSLLYVPLGDGQADSISKSASAAWSELRVARRVLVDWVWKILDECSAMGQSHFQGSRLLRQLTSLNRILHFRRINQRDLHIRMVRAARRLSLRLRPPITITIKGQADIAHSGRRRGGRRRP
jgi:hypothetical protein